jgi:hypothetical protein
LIGVETQMLYDGLFQIQHQNEIAGSPLVSEQSPTQPIPMNRDPAEAKKTSGCLVQDFVKLIKNN